MTLKEMKIKVFSLIEEYYPEKIGLAEDEDVLSKINGVVNQIQLDLMKYRKINAHKEVEITEEDSKKIDLKELLPNCYQIKSIKFGDLVEYDMPNDDTLMLPEDFTGTFDIYYYKYPELVELTFEDTDTQTAEEVSAEYDENYEFELEPDLLEVAPYGIASDLLKMDKISNYGQYFRMEYEARKNMINPNKTAGIITIVGGIDV